MTSASSQKACPQANDYMKEIRTTEKRYSNRVKRDMTEFELQRYLIRDYPIGGRGLWSGRNSRT